MRNEISSARQRANGSIKRVAKFERFINRTYATAQA